jgi:two-component system, NarL family, nitrate/nitrite response regulator NarL
VTRIAIVSPSPLFAQGLAAALAGMADWQVDVHATLADAPAADALVLHAGAADHLSLLPPATPLVLLGDDGARPPIDGRAVARLAPAATPAQLRAALAAVLQGLSVRDAALGWPLPHAAPAGEHEPLTPRELEVFELLGKGLSNRDIGGVLGISAHTAKFHVGQILAKTGAATRAEAVSTGLRLGLIGL